MKPQRSGETSDHYPIARTLTSCLPFSYTLRTRFCRCPPRSVSVRGLRPGVCAFCSGRLQKWSDGHRGVDFCFLAGRRGPDTAPASPRERPRLGGCAWRPEACLRWEDRAAGPVHRPSSWRRGTARAGAREMDGDRGGTRRLRSHTWVSTGLCSLGGLGRRPRALAAGRG